MQQDSVPMWEHRLFWIMNRN